MPLVECVWLIKHSGWECMGQHLTFIWALNLPIKKDNFGRQACMQDMFHQLSFQNSQILRHMIIKQHNQPIQKSSAQRQSMPELHSIYRNIIIQSAVRQSMPALGGVPQGSSLSTKNAVFLRTLKHLTMSATTLDAWLTINPVRIHLAVDHKIRLHVNIPQCIPGRPIHRKPDGLPSYPKAHQHNQQNHYELHHVLNL